LALDFNEEYLQGSSFGTPQDKWRKFLNKDLELLNDSIKEYLFKLQYVAFKDESNFSDSFLADMYSSKRYYSFVRDEYNIGSVEPCSAVLIQNILSTTNNKDTYHLNKFNKIDLSSYSNRIDLQNQLNTQSKILKNKLDDLKEYILKNITLEDLL
jgi:hypothetical protein